MTGQERDIVGFAGIGLMGQPMVMRLLQAGHEVLVWNRTPGRCDELVGQGAEEVDSPRELAEQCDIVLLCLADGAAVEDVVFGEDGLAAALDADQLVVDLSSIAPDTTQNFARELEQACGAGWVDAPVSGGPGGAERGSLIVFAGGQADDVERAQAVLGAFAQRVTHMGSVGAGQLTKLCNQVLVCNTTLAVAETIALAERCGIDAEQLPGALAGGLADSPVLRALGPRMAVREYEPVLARLATMQKDLDTVLGVAREVDATAPFSALAAQLVRAHRLTAGNAADCTTLIELYARD